jgi:hypothetical protein
MGIFKLYHYPFEGCLALPLPFVYISMQPFESEVVRATRSNSASFQDAFAGSRAGLAARASPYAPLRAGRALPRPLGDA